MTPPQVRLSIRFIVRRIVAASAAALALHGCGRGEENPVTLAIVNGRVWTGDEARPWAEALAVRRDSIVFVGKTSEVQAMVDKEARAAYDAYLKKHGNQKSYPMDSVVLPTARVIDAGGGLVAPGFIDSHVHFSGGGFALASVQLRDAGSKQEFIARIRKYVGGVEKGAWITSGDWDHTNWGGELPTREWIDSVTPDNPVWINRLDGHMNLANSAALRIAKVDAGTRDVAGGTIVRDASGNPTGILKDNAMDLVERVRPPRPDAEWDAGIVAAMAHVAARGVTSVHDMDGWEAIRTYRRLQVTGRLHTRIMSGVPLSDWRLLADTIKRLGSRGDAMLRIGRLKGFVDGSLGSHTAAMNAPFTDSPRDSGFFVTRPDSLYAWTKSADSAGLQVAVHAIGDRAIRTQLDVFQRVARENGARDRRFRIEHAQHIAPDDMTRFGIIGVIASMQPYHAVDDGRWAEGVIGPVRAEGTYAFRSLIDARATLAFGSDWFVAPPTPLEGIQAAVTRRTLDGKHPGGWVPSQKITVEEALRAYTSGAAFAGFQEKEVGRLVPGLLADIVILDRDITKIAPEMISQAVVKFTIVNGGVVYEKK